MQNLSSLKGKKIALITHSGADVDAICAAASLHAFLKKKNRASILVPEHISVTAKTLAKNLKIPYSLAQSQSLKKFDTLFLIDFNDIKMAGCLANEIKRFKGSIFLLDHHRPAKKKIAPSKNTLADQNAVASCELVLDLFKKIHVRLDKKTAACLAAGLVTDSAYFLTANAKTFSMMSYCLKSSGKTFSSITSLFSVKQSFDEKIAKLKAAKRARIFLVSNYIAVISDVGAFESDAASALVKVGADIAFAGDSDEGKLRISGRASQHVTKKAGFDLAKHVFQKLPKTFPGSGGGHAGAAGFNGKGNNIQAALQECINLTTAFFKKRKGFLFKEYT